MAKQRDGFTFYRSYFDVYEELNDKDKVAFMDALLKKQFKGIEPTNLKGMANFAYLSQKHSVDKQVKGWEDKTGVNLFLHENPPLARVVQTPSVQEKEEEKEQVQEKEEVEVEEEFKRTRDATATELNFSRFNSSRIELIWKDWKEYKLSQHKEKFKSLSTEQVAINKLGELSNWTTEKAAKIVEQSISFLWKGLFELKNNNQNGTKERITADEQIRRAVDRVVYGDQQPTGSEIPPSEEEATWTDVT